MYTSPVPYGSYTTLAVPKGLTIKNCICFFFTLQTCFLLNLANLTFLCGKKPIWNKMVTFFKCNSVEDAIARAQWLFTVYMGKPVCSRFGQVNFVPGSHSWVPFTEKPPRKGETGIKDGFEEMENGFPFGILRPGKLDYVNFSDVMFLSGIFHRHDPTSRVPFTFHTDF